MAEATISADPPTLYFRERVEAAIRNQKLAAKDLTAFYVVNLLAGFSRLESSPGPGEDWLGPELLKAMQAGGSLKRERLRRVGDKTLLILGFFPERVDRKMVDTSYYINLGELAYGTLARRQEDGLVETFRELAQNFSAYVDVLEEVRESSDPSNCDLLRHYEKFARTGSIRSRNLLIEHGITPIDSPGSDYVQ